MKIDATCRWWHLQISLLVLLLSSSTSTAATIQKNDDTTVTGNLSAIAGGKVTVIADSKPVVIPLDEISQIILKAPVAAVVPPSQAVDTSNNNANGDSDDSPSLIGMLFGSGSHHHSASSSSNATPASTQAVVTAAPNATTNASATPATQPIATDAEITLTNGDSFHARVKKWADQKVQLSFTSGALLELPSTAFTQLWIGSADLQIKAKAHSLEAGPEDVVFVAKDNDVVTVKGLVQGIAGESLLFRFDEQDRKINLSKIVGVLLRSNSPAAITGFHQRVRTDSGDQFSGLLTGMDHDQLILAFADSAATQIRIPTSSVTAVDFLNGRVTSLCDVKVQKVEQTAYFGRVLPYRIDHSLSNGPLVFSDGPVSRGIAVHSRCVLQYSIDGSVDRFKTRLGFQQPEGLHGRVIARVIADGKPLYENLDARGDQPPVDIDVSLAGVHSLTLEVDFGKDQDAGDRVIWANPRLIRGK